MNNIDIKVVETEQKLKEIFCFLSKTFYDESIEFNERYFTMSERYIEMKEQYNKDNELIFYIEEDGKILGALTSKDMNLDLKKITLGVMAIAKTHRRKGYAKALIEKFEEECLKKDIVHISLGARFRACPLYINLGYKAKLMVQVFDFAKVEDIKKVNINNLKEEFEYQNDTYGFIFFDIDAVDEEKIKHFENNVPTAHAQYIFEKDLM